MKTKNKQIRNQAVRLFKLTFPVVTFPFPLISIIPNFYFVISRVSKGTYKASIEGQNFSVKQWRQKEGWVSLERRRWDYVEMRIETIAHLALSSKLGW